MDASTSIFVLVVSIAAIFIILEKIGAFTMSVVKWYAQKTVGSVDSLHEKAEEEIQGSFELWWNSGPNERVAQAIKVKMFGEDAQDVPDEIVTFLTGQMGERPKFLAQHIAIHAFIDQEQRSMIDKLPRMFGARRQAALKREREEQNLIQERAELLDYGLDASEIDKHFTPTP